MFNLIVLLKCIQHSITEELPENKMNIKQNILHSVKWSAGSKYFGQLITWAITIYVMRLLSPSDYGLVSMAGVFVGFAMLLSELGIGPALIQSRELDENILRQSLSVVIILCSSLFTIVYISAPFIAIYYAEPRLINIVRIMAIQFIIMIFYVIPQSLLSRELRFKEISLIDLCGNVVGGIVTLILAFCNFGAISLVLGPFTMMVVRTIGVNFVRPVLNIPTLTLKNIRPLIGYGQKVTLSRFLWFIFTQVDIFIIGKMLGKDLLGYYSIALLLATIPLEKTSGILTQVAFPAYSTLQHDKSKAAQYFVKTVRIVTFLFIPLMWGMSSLGHEIISTFLGPRWNMAIIPFQIIALIVPLRMISSMMQPLLDGIGRPDLSLVNLLAGCVVMPLGFYVGSYWGIVGISLAWLVLFPVVFICNLYTTLSCIGLRFGDIYAATRNAVFSGICMYGAIYLLKNYMLDGWNIYFTMALCFMVGISVYLGMMFVVSRKAVEEVFYIFKEAGQTTG
jgi:teichuronic acid exporter